MQIRDFLLGLLVGGAAMFYPRWRVPAARGRREDVPAWETVYKEFVLEQGPSVAAIGGGTGLSTLLRGLKQYSSNLAAIVNVTDDGGSSGRLRENLDMLPPGDIRNCLLALANTEPLLEKVFQYRFSTGDGLEGHNLGNLFLAALTDQFGFEKAILAASDVLAVKGSVLPVTLSKVNVVASMSDGQLVRGESRIPQERGRIRRLYLEPDNSVVYAAAAKAISDADVVVVGPGSLYTSVLANLLVPGVVEAMRKSDARKVYICNVMTQPGETDGYTAADHLQAIYDHVGQQLFDVIIINDNLDIPSTLLLKYANQGSVPVLPDTDRLERLGVTVLAANLMSHQELVRHDPQKLAELVFTEALNRQSGAKAAKKRFIKQVTRRERGVFHDVRTAGEK